MKLLDQWQPKPRRLFTGVGNYSADTYATEDDIFNTLTVARINFYVCFSSRCTDALSSLPDTY